MYTKLPLNISEHICTIVGYNDGSIVVRKATPLAVMYQQGDIEMEDLKQMIGSKKCVVDYLEQHFNLDPRPLERSTNWGLLDGEVVILDFSTKKS